MRATMLTLAAMTILGLVGCGEPKRVAGERRSIDLSSFPKDTKVTRLADGSAMIIVPPAIKEVRVSSPDVVTPHGRTLSGDRSGPEWNAAAPARRKIDLSSFPKDTVVRRLEDGSVMIIVPSTVKDVKLLGPDITDPEGKKLPDAEGTLSGTDTPDPKTKK